MKLKTIVVNGQVFLGELHVEDGEVLVANAITDIPNDLGRKEFVKYIQHHNLSKLTAVKFAGAGTTYSSTTLTEDQKLELQIVLLTMRKAKKTTIRNLENKELESLLGKL